MVFDSPHRPIFVTTGTAFSWAFVGRLAHCAYFGIAPFILLLASCMRDFLYFNYPAIHSFLGDHYGCSIFSALCSGYWLDLARPLFFAWATIWTNSGGPRYPFVGQYLMHFLDWGFSAVSSLLFLFCAKRRMDGLGLESRASLLLPTTTITHAHSQRLFSSSRDFLLTFAFLLL